MYDDLQGKVRIFDFDEFANHLLEQGLEASPSELHGFLCGLLSGGAAAEPEMGLNALDQSLGLVLHGELADHTMQLYTVTAAALEDEEFDFHPLLPDDDDDIVVRTAALAAWSRGFLAGFAHITAGTGTAPVALPEDSGEILKDFANIAQADTDEDETEDDAEDSYMELVEYLRFATLNVYMDTRARE
ncbi:MAG TPA: hypothetical protein ENH48_09485 [Halieaceae bacterium]|nr:MAG: hypothetical protein DRQ98_00920 [Gammaproteobacteria bacterium]HDY83169.1 hypothetical protein [Halieaceae bacterium]